MLEVFFVVIHELLNSPPDWPHPILRSPAPAGLFLNIIAKHSDCHLKADFGNCQESLTSNCIDHQDHSITAASSRPPRNVVGMTELSVGIQFPSPSIATVYSHSMKTRARMLRDCMASSTTPHTVPLWFCVISSTVIVWGTFSCSIALT